MGEVYECWSGTQSLFSRFLSTSPFLSLVPTISSSRLFLLSRFFRSLPPSSLCRCASLLITSCAQNQCEINFSLSSSRKFSNFMVSLSPSPSFSLTNTHSPSLSVSVSQLILSLIFILILILLARDLSLSLATFPFSFLSFSRERSISVSRF